MKSLFLLNTGQLEGEFGNAMGGYWARGGASGMGVKVQRNEGDESQYMSSSSRLVASRERYLGASARSASSSLK